ncbi:MAG: hypothetical protein CVV03_03060 [Firmicutes bacterium HGW-Firmicutes-8]|nr:MAG: hypothetical protein CVV03_03060 [Firmicutes bacterium HGW-Firmicutes-8]
MMKFAQSVSSFLNAKPIQGYESNLKVFREFLKNRGISDNTLKVYLQGMRTKAFIESLNFYIDNRGVSSIDTAQRYVSALKEYFLFLIDEGLIINNELLNEIGLPIYSEKSFRNQLNTSISEDKRLEKGDFVKGFSENVAIDLIASCDETLKIDIKQAVSKKNLYNSFLSALIIKLLLFTGLAYRQVTKISLAAYSERYNVLSINGFRIHMPIIMSDQIRRYISIRETVLYNIKQQSELFFVEFDGKNLAYMTSRTAKFLAGLSGRKDLNGLIKYAITSMIRKGVNESIIKKFTGVGDTIYNSCQDIVNDEMDENSTRYLDSKLRSLKIWDLL